MIQVLSEPFRMDENLGLDFLGIPGTNGPDRLYGGWPQFAVTGFSTIGYAGSEHSPYVDDNWQYQYSANTTWTKGAHTFRFGGDIVRQAMNRHETGLGLRHLHVRRRADDDSRRTLGEQFQQLRDVHARPADDDLEEPHSVRGQLHEKPQLAVQPVRQGPVADRTRR